MQPDNCVEALVFSVHNTPVLDLPALDEMTNEQLLNKAIQLLEGIEIRIKINQPTPKQHRSRQSKNYLITIPQRLIRRIQGTVLKMFVQLAWRKPAEFEDRAMCTTIDRSSLLSIANQALHDVGFNEPLAYKSQIWRSTVAEYLDNQSIPVPVPSGTSSDTESSSPPRKSSKPLTLVDLRTPTTTQDFSQQVRSYLVEVINKAQHHISFEQMDH